MVVFASCFITLMNGAVEMVKMQRDVKMSIGRVVWISATWEEKIVISLARKLPKPRAVALNNTGKQSAFAK